jgi:hypothetical protein
MPPDKRWHDWHLIVWEYGIRKLVESCGGQKGAIRMMAKKEVGGETLLRVGQGGREGRGSLERNSKRAFMREGEGWGSRKVERTREARSPAAAVSTDAAALKVHPQSSRDIQSIPFHVHATRFPLSRLATRPGPQQPHSSSSYVLSNASNSGSQNPTQNAKPQAPIPKHDNCTPDEEQAGGGDEGCDRSGKCAGDYPWITPHIPPPLPSTLSLSLSLSLSLCLFLESSQPTSLSSFCPMTRGYELSVSCSCYCYCLCWRLADAGPSRQGNCGAGRGEEGQDRGRDMAPQGIPRPQTLNPRL